MAITFGYKASAEQFGPRELLDYSVYAENAGLDTIAVSDHFQPWRHHGGHAPNALVWLGASALALADDGHYQNFLVGERAAGMGGAFTAIANDPSGTYYNPAGLVDIKSNASNLPDIQIYLQCVGVPPSTDGGA